MKNIFIAILALSSTLAHAELQFSDQRVRAVPTTQKITGGFVSITNNSDTNLAIVAASSPISEAVELHTHVKKGDRMMMRKVPQIDLPAMETTMLQPGGLHLMFIGLKQPLSVGDQINVTIKLNDGSTEKLMMPVQMVNPMMQNQISDEHQRLQMSQDN